MFVASMFVEADHASSRQPGNRAREQWQKRPGCTSGLFLKRFWPQLWTAMVSSTSVDAMVAGINTAHFQRCFLKAERISSKTL